MNRIRIAILLILCQPHLFCQSRPTQLDVYLVVDNSSRMRGLDPSRFVPIALATFATRLPPHSQVGIVIFDKRATSVLQLTSIDGRQFQTKLKAALKKVSYKGSRSDLGGALERAIYELRQQARSDAEQAMVLVTNGVPDLGSRRASAVNARWAREDLAAEAHRFGIRAFVVTVNQSADFQLVLSLARKTDGEYYRALVPSTLPGALAQINDKLTDLVEPRPVLPGKPMGRNAFAGHVMVRSVILISMVVLTLVAVFVWRRSSRSNLAESHGTENGKPSLIPLLSGLREQGGEVSRELSKAAEVMTAIRSRAKQFQSAVERYALANYNVLQETEEQFFTLARECILLSDHLEIMLRRGEEKGESTDSLQIARNRVCSLLETAQIEEIQVTAGEVFDGAFQVATSVIDVSGPAGVVMGVSRKGYVMKLTGKKDVLLRAAEVTVSSGNEVPQHGSGGPDETKTRH